MCCSWVQFWLTKTEKGGEIAARTSLGATTVLTVVTIGFEGKSKPQVSLEQRVPYQFKTSRKKFRNRYHNFF